MTIAIDSQVSAFPPIRRRIHMKSLVGSSCEFRNQSIIDWDGPMARSEKRVHTVYAVNTAVPLS